MKRKIFLISFIIFVVFSSVIGAFSASRIFKIRGFFEPESTWTGGASDTVSFEIGVLNSGVTANINESGYLSGFFWLGNVGWGTFSHGIGSCEAQIRCPEDIANNPNQVCRVHGCAWSQNAGWIVMSGSDIGGSETGVYYNPATAKLEGFGWSNALGWVPFYGDILSGTPTSSQTGITVDGLNVNFLGKIAVVGNIAGTRIYNLPNQSVGYIFSPTDQASIINTIRKNLAFLMRNVSVSLLADPFSPLDFMVIQDQDYVFDNANPIWPTGKSTIVTIGHDIMLDNVDINLYGDTKPRALIALKDENGSGGNIVISDNVKRIFSLMYAEGSIFSGEKTATGYIEPYIASSVFNIPTNQLYIYGLIISKNTIGGAQQTPPQCPIVLTECTQDISEFYDLNFMRTYDPNQISQRSLPAHLVSDSRFDRASVVIDYDSRVLSDPPPGLLNISQ